MIFVDLLWFEQYTYCEDHCFFKVEGSCSCSRIQNVAKRGGTIAGNARRELEANTGRKVVSKNNANNKKLLGK